MQINLYKSKENKKKKCKCKRDLFCLHRKKKWTLAKAAQVLTTTVFNLCVVVPTNPFLLHKSCMQTTKLMFIPFLDYCKFLFIYIFLHHICSFWKHKLQLSSLLVFSPQVVCILFPQSPWNVRPIFCPWQEFSAFNCTKKKTWNDWLHIVGLDCIVFVDFVGSFLIVVWVCCSSS